jgi:hypothetical protein
LPGSSPTSVRQAARWRGLVARRRQDARRRPRSPTNSSPPPPRNPSPHFSPLPRSPEPHAILTLTRLPAGLRPNSPPASIPGHRRPRQDARGELLSLPVPSASLLSLCIAAPMHHLPRPPHTLAAGHAPVANNGRRRHQSPQRVAPRNFPHARAPASRPSAGLSSARAQFRAHGHADVSMTSA